MQEPFSGMQIVNKGVKRKERWRGQVAYLWSGLFFRVGWADGGGSGGAAVATVNG